MAQWTDSAERWPGSTPGANFIAEDLGPWEAVRVARVSLDVDGGWKIHVMRENRWREIGIVYASRSEAMRVAEAAAADPATRLLVLAAEKVDKIAAEAWRLASEAAVRAAGRSPAGAN